MLPTIEQELLTPALELVNVPERRPFWSGPWRLAAGLTRVIAHLAGYDGTHSRLLQITPRGALRCLPWYLTVAPDVLALVDEASAPYADLGDEAHERLIQVYGPAEGTASTAWVAQSHVAGALEANIGFVTLLCPLLGHVTRRYIDFASLTADNWYLVAAWNL